MNEIDSVRCQPEIIDIWCKQCARFTLTPDANTPLMIVESSNANDCAFVRKDRPPVPKDQGIG
jgi:hypothetical protein